MIPRCLWVEKIWCFCSLPEMLSLLAKWEIVANICKKHSLIEKKCNYWCTRRVCFRHLTVPFFSLMICHYQLSTPALSCLMMTQWSVIRGKAALKYRKKERRFASCQKWLNNRRLTWNITKSKFTVVGGKQQLKGFWELGLTIEEDELSRESTYKYLGIIINGNLT